MPYDGESLGRAVLHKTEGCHACDRINGSDVLILAAQQGVDV